MVELTAYLEDIVHEPTQKADRGFDLTVAETYEISESGRVDFGGGELEEADVTPHERRQRNPDDEYEWWELDGGQYLLEYNESLQASDRTFPLQTRDELLARGAFHPTVHVSTLPRIPLSVAGRGLKLKENARVSTLLDGEQI